jgi:hypothetical protein
MAGVLRAIAEYRRGRVCQARETSQLLDERDDSVAPAAPARIGSIVCDYISLDWLSW